MLRLSYRAATRLGKVVYAIGVGLARCAGAFIVLSVLGIFLYGPSMELMLAPDVVVLVTPLMALGATLLMLSMATIAISWGRHLLQRHHEVKDIETAVQFVKLVKSSLSDDDTRHAGLADTLTLFEQERDRIVLTPDEYRYRHEYVGGGTL